MRRRIVSVIVVCGVLIATASLLAACTVPVASGVELVPSGTPAKAASGARPTEAFVSSVDAFGIDLLRATRAAAGPSDNVIVSPASVDAALAMTANGATGETADQMRKVLHTSSMSPADSNAQWAALLAALESRDSAQTLAIANALFARKDIAFKQPFLSSDRDSFGAQISTLDFAKDDVPGIINAWVSKNTRGMITKMVDQTPSNAILYLANAVYFKGEWVTPFDHESTQKQAFTKADRSDVQVDMMYSSGSMPYAQNASLQATKLVYQGLDASFYVMLPRKGVSVDAALASLAGTGFSDLRATMMSPDTTEVVLELPKLDTEFGATLNGPLSSMGMPLAFDDQRAQFGGMAELDVPIYIGRVIHKTKVKVDEKGTEAAAATVVEMGVGAAAPAVEPLRIICDRPYLFAIVDEKSGAMLFLGTVNDPTK